MKILFPQNTNTTISIFIIWLFHLCGLLGILYGNRELFIAFTPINLFVSFALLFINQVELDRKNLLAGLAIFLIGMISEILGVQYGFIFGDYIYLNNLGFKILGVPIMIGVNWIILTYITGSFSNYIFNNNKKIAVVFGAILMVVLDLLIEPVAPELGFWAFDSIYVPLQNYIGWFIIGLFVQIIYHYSIDKKDTTFSFHLLLVQFIFFTLLNFIAL
jgi:bisanhydrobacterioruberin hydratase|tara:strand:+ start:68011 stop:68661 length:651 start_codon:yes stop_codon:yes gene_type:complete